MTVKGASPPSEDARREKAVSFWRSRAADPGWLSVMWRNPAYNEGAHRDQWAAIEGRLPARRESVLDLGCGTGRLSERLASLFPSYTGVDLDTMVEEARRRNPGLAGRYETASVQEYAYPRDRFDLVLSMACLASACTAADLRALAPRMLRSVRPGGRVILVDPFHRFPPLVRTCRITSREVIAAFEGEGARLVAWTGLHCIPVRLLLARAAFARFPRFTRAGYAAGEAALRLAPRLLGDYQVIVLERPPEPPCTSA